MNISELLLLLEKDSSARVAVFGVDQGAHIFISLFIQLLREKKNYALQQLQLQPEFDLNSLQVSFLGMSLIYFLDIRIVDDKKRLAIVQYVRQYKGPHFLIIITDQIIKDLPLVDLFNITLPMYNQLFEIFYPTYVRKKSSVIVEKLFQQLSIISIDTACIMMQYQIVLGNNTTQFMQEWLDEIVMPEKSLFMLSSHFFAKNSAMFWKYWNTIKNDYPDIFWVTFWSEQLFRAHGYIWYRKNKPAESKNIAHRLPFSYIQKDYKRYSHYELAKAHDCLYNHDYYIKNGGTQSLDLFYLQFLLDEFK